MQAAETLADSVSTCVGGRCGLGPNCFVAGTPVLSERGLVSIEEIRAGDLVWSKDDVTGEEGWRPVVRTFVTPDQEVLRIELIDENGAPEVLGTTAEHPFWVEEKGWTLAGDLGPGDLVLSAHGGWLRVSSSTWTQERATVYNFEVEGTHTYFVGQLGAWVHNVCAARIGELRAQVKALGDLGLDGAQRRAFFRGEAGFFSFESAGASIGGYAQRLSDSRIRVVVNAWHAPGGSGQTGFLRFLGRSRGVARAFGAGEVEGVAAMIANPGVKQMAVGLGMEAGELALPSALGGGTWPAFFKVWGLR